MFVNTRAAPGDRARQNAIERPRHRDINTLVMRSPRAVSYSADTLHTHITRIVALLTDVGIASPRAALDFDILHGLRVFNYNARKACVSLIYISSPHYAKQTSVSWNIALTLIAF